MTVPEKFPAHFYEERYTYCPDCGRKSVMLALCTDGEDNYYCKYRGCHFYFYTAEPIWWLDGINRVRWQLAQTITKEGRICVIKDKQALEGIYDDRL